jgi:ribosomal protein S27AE
MQSENEHLRGELAAYKKYGIEPCGYRLVKATLDDNDKLKKTANQAVKETALKCSENERLKKQLNNIMDDMGFIEACFQSGKRPCSVCEYDGSFPHAPCSKCRYGEILFKYRGPQDTKVKAAEVQESKMCPKCNSTMAYDPYFKKIVCRQCGYTRVPSNDDY